MNTEQLFLKLMIRRYLMGSPVGAYRSMVLNNFPRVPTELKIEVIDACIREGSIIVSEGTRGAQILTWHEEKNIALVG